METLAGFPFLPLEMTKDGAPDAAQHDALLAALAGDFAAVTDLVVISHGWNNDMAEARALYQGLLTSMRALLDAGRPSELAGRRFGVLALYWPSKKFADEALKPEAVLAGGGAAFGEAEGVPADALRAAIERLGELLGLSDDPRLAALKAHADGLRGGADAERAFVEALRSLLPDGDGSEDDASEQLLSRDGSDLLRALAEPLYIVPPDAGGGAAGMSAAGGGGDAVGAAASLASMFSGIRSGAWRLLNFSTYYVMKQRAGVVGRGLNAILEEVRARRPDLRLHLVGHSFGARLVTAAVDGPHDLHAHSLSLLQGAFSQNGFCADISGQPGIFRNVIAKRKVEGPIVVTHTRNDLAVGVAYAIASRLVGDNRSDFGGPEDQFGGLGRNGAQRLAAAEFTNGQLQADTAVYPPFGPATVTNLRADSFIHGHSDVTSPAVANAVLSAFR